MSKRSPGIVAILVGAQALILLSTTAIVAGYWYRSMRPMVLSGERTKAELLSAANLPAIEEATSWGDQDRLDFLFGRILLLTAPETGNPMVVRLELKLRDGTHLVRPASQAGQPASGILVESPVFSSLNQEFLGTLSLYYDEALYQLEARRALRLLQLAAVLLMALNGTALVLMWILLRPLTRLAAALRRPDTAGPFDLPALGALASGEIRRVYAALHSLLDRLTEARRREQEEAQQRALDLEERIAERERAQNELQQLNQVLLRRSEELAAKNEEVEAFVYAVSHDLRAPLVNLQGFSAELEFSYIELRRVLLDMRLPEPLAGDMRRVLEEEIPADIRYIVASIDKFDRLISALLKLSRTGRRELRLERLAMEEIVQGAVDSIRHVLDLSGAEVEIGSLPPAWGDATTVSQVFSNLLSNAVTYLEPGRRGRIEVGGEERGDAGHYWVRDNGRGLPPGAGERLFQVFQRFHPEVAPGEGLGLNIVKRGIERHGGRVWVESQEGAGCAFHFVLPHPPGWSADSAAAEAVTLEAVTVEKEAS